MTLEELEEFYEKYGIEKSKDIIKVPYRFWEVPPIPEGKRLIFECF